MKNLVPAGPVKDALAQRLLFVADHASNHIPEGYRNLGVSPERLREHIAWDIGAADVARAVRNRVGGRFWQATVSRLLIDLNRDPDHPGLIPETSDGVLITGNVGLSSIERQRRLDLYFHPYHEGLAAEIDAVAESHPKGAVLVSIHSFTPSMNGQERPWHVGILYNQDERLARPAIEWLRRQPGLIVGDNEPYSGRVLNYTMDRHAEARGLPYLSVEIRQDLISNAKGVEEWGERLAALLIHLLS